MNSTWALAKRPLPMVYRVDTFPTIPVTSHLPVTFLMSLLHCLPCLSLSRKIESPGTFWPCPAMPAVSTASYYWPLMSWSKPERCKCSIKPKTLSHALQVFSSKCSGLPNLQKSSPTLGCCRKQPGTGVPIHSCTESVMVLKMFCWTRILNIWKTCMTWFLLFISKLNIKTYFPPVWFAMQINKYFASNGLQNGVAQIPPPPVLHFGFFFKIHSWNYN